MRSFGKLTVLSRKLKYSRQDFAQGKPAFGGEPFNPFKDAEFKGGENVERLHLPRHISASGATSSIQKEYRCSLEHQVCQMEHCSAGLAVMMSISAQKTTAVEVFP
jgi:hypothetical protein